MSDWQPPQTGSLGLYDVPSAFFTSFGAGEQTEVATAQAATKATGPVVVDKSGKWTALDESAMRARLHETEEAEVQSSSSDDEEQEQDASASVTQVESNVQGASMLFRHRGCCFTVCKALLGLDKHHAHLPQSEQRSTSTAAVKGLAKSEQWGFLMLRSGHFAAAVFNREKLVSHKTSHRYTSRRKQGGDQSAADARGKRHQSAGANLRRYNERALAEEVKELVLNWQEELLGCDLIFLSASSRNIGLFHTAAAECAGKGSGELRNAVPWAKGDRRIRSIPFATGRPTLETIKKVHKNLALVRFFAPDYLDKDKDKDVAAAAGESAGTHQKGRTTSTAADAPAPAPAPAPKPKPARVHGPLFAAVAAGDAARALALLGASMQPSQPPPPPAAAANASAEAEAEAEAEADGSADVSLPEALTAEELPEALAECDDDEDTGTGMTVLHLAAAAGCAELVTALLAAGASPLVVDYRDRVPARAAGAGVDAAGSAATAAGGAAGAGGAGEEGEPEAAKAAKAANTAGGTKGADKGKAGGSSGGAAETEKQKREREKERELQRRQVTDAFRRYAGGHLEEWDWKAAGVDPLTEEDVERKKAKEKAKKKAKRQRAAAKKKAQKAEDAVRKAEEAAREAEEERLRAEASLCANCRQPRALPFERLGYKYCSTKCVNDHKRVLAAEAAERRMAGGLVHA